MQPMMSRQDADALLAVVKTLPDNARLIEWGCGGSTLMFADHLQPGRSLDSIEHYEPWYLRVTAALQTHPARDRVRVHHRQIAFDLTRVFARPEEELPAGCQDYIHPNIDVASADFAFVDGVARGAVLAMLRSTLRPGTPVFLHDYRGRENWYDWAVRLFTRVAVHDLLIEMRVPEVR